MASAIGRAKRRIEDLREIEAQFVRADANVAVEAGFDWLELHCAHGYLLSSFLSPLTNHRTDEYGGSLENRLRLSAAKCSRRCAPCGPQDKPISVRISAHDWVDGGTTPDDAVEIARAFKAAGADMIDVSSGQVSKDEKPVYGRMFQTPFADRVRNEAGIATIAVGAISEADHVNSIIAAGRADLCAIARPHLANPAWTLNEAAKIGYFDIAWPKHYRRREVATRTQSRTRARAAAANAACRRKNARNARRNGVTMHRSRIGQHAVVTGGGSGIGAAIAQALVARRRARHADGPRRGASRLRSATSSRTDGDVQRASASMSRRKSRSRPRSQAQPPRRRRRYPRQQRGTGASRAVHAHRLALWQRMLDVNLTGVFLCTHAALARMLERGSGRIVNVASTAGQIGYAYVAAYCAAKHGVIGLTRSLALEVATKGVTVNAVCPGYTETELLRAIARTDHRQDLAQRTTRRAKPCCARTRNVAS